MTDHKPLTEQQLTDIETRANAATPGPWCTDSWEIYQGGEDDIPALMKWIGETCRADDSDGSRNDAAFIAHARTDVPALLDEIRRLKAVCGDLADRWDKEATGTQKAIDIDPLGGEVESAQHERVHVYRTAAQDLRALLATGRVPEDLLTTTERTPAAAAVVSLAAETPEPTAAASEACGKCKQPFDSADTRFDGRGQYASTPYCRGCVDNCHEGGADHRCVICA